MKKSFLLGFGSLLCLLASCSSDTHYDSISTELSLDVAQLTDSSKSMTLRHRFAFDRDLVPLSSVSLEDAWISAATVDKNNPDAPVFDLEAVQSVSISIVENDETAATTFWLYSIPDAYSYDAARFSEMSVGDLRDYMRTSDNPMLELEIKVFLKPYPALRYWRDACNMSKTCEVSLPISMQFKMED